MSRATLNVPESLELTTALKFCGDLQRSGTHEEYTLNFSKARTVSPFGMLLVSSEIQSFLKAHPGAKFICRNHGHMDYAAHMGFFQAFRDSFGKAPGQAQGSSSYIPITIYKTEKLMRDAASVGLDVGDEIEAQSKRLTATLLGEEQGDVYETLSYSIREIMRNAAEHSLADSIAICSAYWPSKGRAEVAIIDRGIGLRSSLSSNPHINASDDRAAISYALMPAVSGKAFKGSPPQRGRGHWTNSGFGLYMTSRICRNGGNFFIASGTTGTLLTAGSGGKRTFETSLDGTAIRMTIRTDEVADLKGRLARYRDEGYEIQRKYRDLVKIDPSSASLMLSEDFSLTTWDRLLRAFKS